MTETTKTRKAPVKLTDEQLIADLGRIARKIKRSPLTRDVAKYGKVTPQTYINRFGTLNAAKEQAGLSIVGRGRPTKTNHTLTEVVTKVAGNRHKRGLTPAQIAERVAKTGLVEIAAKNPERSIREALNASGLFTRQTDGTYTRKTTPVEQTIATVEQEQVVATVEQVEQVEQVIAEAITA